MTTGTDTQRINAIVGEAIKALVESGASSDVVGAFAFNYPDKVATLMGKPKVTADSIDLEKIIQETVVRVVRAAGLVQGKTKSDKSASRINVLVQGKRTSVFLPSSTLGAVVSAKGSKPLAKALIQEFADSLPSDVGNRSAWIDEKLHGFLVLSNSTIDAAPRH